MSMGSKSCPINSQLLLTAYMEHLCARHDNKAEETADPVLMKYIF